MARLTAPLAAAICVLALAMTGARADMIVTDGMEPWDTCGGCHNLDGISKMSRFPKLAAQNRAYIEKQLNDFRAERRHNDGGQMKNMASELAPDDIPKVATYFSGLPPPPPVPTPLDPAAADRARMLVEAGRPADGIPACLSCHGGRADLVTPRLEAQHADYLAKELRDLRAGERANDPAGVMRAVAARLSDADIQAVSQYLAAQKRPETPSQPR